jgi:hypothetical protein
MRFETQDNLMGNLRSLGLLIEANNMGSNKKYQIHELAVNDEILESRKVLLCDNNESLMFVLKFHCFQLQELELKMQIIVHVKRYLKCR